MKENNINLNIMENKIRESLIEAIPKTKELADVCLKVGDVEMFNIAERILDCLEKLTSGNLDENEELKYSLRLFIEKKVLEERVNMMVAKSAINTFFKIIEDGIKDDNKEK